MNTFEKVVNLEDDLAFYNMLIVNYKFELANIRKLLIKLENCPTSEIMGDLCKDITESKEDSQLFLEEIVDISTQLIKDMESLNQMLEDYAL
ncbi:MAG: hypothetical protein ACI389_02160 [Methanobrevibacter sp.]|uniref:hypothetical protein n=1 Tax=Methanobrevibacter sp. TaxID=66852 RepID=UPI003F014B3F